MQCRLGVARPAPEGPRASGLDDAWEFLSVGASLVVQRFIEGPLGNTIALFDRGRLIRWVSSFKTRTHPGSFGPSSARRFTHREEVGPILDRFGAATGYH